MGTVRRPGGWADTADGYDERAAPSIPGIATITPDSFREARTIGEYFRGGVPVVMNLTGMDHADAKRVVDFASGLVFSLRGRLERVAQRVFLLLPEGLSLLTAAEAPQTGSGFFNAR